MEYPDQPKETSPLLAVGPTRSWQRCRRLLLARIPILGWLPGYTPGRLLQDVLAGFTVGLTAIPQGIAYATVAGLPPQYGLYSGFMGCFVYLFLGSSKDVTVGPTAIMALLTQPQVARLGQDVAVLLSFLAGCVVLCLGLLQLGFLVEFISVPVVAGFSNAAALIIAASQIGTLLGIQGRPDSFLDSVASVVRRIGEANLPDAALGLGCALLLVGMKNLPGKKRGNALEKVMWLTALSRNAIVVVVGILLAVYMSHNGGVPFAITGKIVRGLPSFQPPPFSLRNGNTTLEFAEVVQQLGGSIVSISLIAILESVAIAKTFAKGRPIDATQEMLALGLSNLLGSFVSSMPTTGSFTRTAVNNASGVKTPMAGVITGALVLMACGLLTSAFEFIPKPTLAAVIIVAMIYMMELRVFVVLWRTKKIELIPIVVTLISCLGLGMEYGILVGVLVNLLLLLYSTARPELSIDEELVFGTKVLLVVPKQSVSFPAAQYIRERVIRRCDKRSDKVPVVIDGGNVAQIDATVAKNLAQLVSDLKIRQHRLIFWNWQESARRSLMGYDDSLGSLFIDSKSLDTIFSTVEDPPDSNLAV